MKVQFFVIQFFLILLADNAVGQAFRLKDREVKSDTDLLKTTTWVHAFSLPGKNSFGTGYFFYSIKLKRLYLITNKHIVRDFDKLAWGFNKTIRGNSYFAIDSLQKRVTRFKNDSTDLLAIRIDNIPYLKLNDFSCFKVFTEKNLVPDAESAKLSLFGENLISLSFPQITTIPFPSQPYIFHCFFATPYDNQFQGAEHFCINGNLTEGRSGSPIIYLSKEKTCQKYYLLGTYYFTFANYKEIDSIRLDTIKTYSLQPVLDKSVTRDNKPVMLDGFKVKLPFQLGIVIKSQRIVDLLDQYKAAAGNSY